LEFDFSKAGQSDSLKDTINYTRVYDTIERVLTAGNTRLLETLATRIVRQILDSFPVDRTRVRVRKMIPPIPGSLDFIEVELEQRRGA
jgi:dihydroneopterin aldolase